ncbi:MAG: hypothetical protein HY526_13375 [Betaproteobacteria bacterium]|nr:hypothetical protein [Betaproteobacteria bacterium]
MSERRISAVPAPVLVVLGAALIVQIASEAGRPSPLARAEALPVPPRPAMARMASLDEPIAAAYALTLYLQAFDNQPGISIPFRHLDYPRVVSWLDTILNLDPYTRYPLLMASHLYAQVPDETRQRQMLDFVHRRFRDDPDRRWRWLAHAVIVAKHRLNDTALALAYARDLARLAQKAPSWARQMRIFILEETGEFESASVLLGGLLASGEITDANEIRFLTQRLEVMKAGEKSSLPSKN